MKTISLFINVFANDLPDGWDSLSQAKACVNHKDDYLNTVETIMTVRDDGVVSVSTIIHKL